MKNYFVNMPFYDMNLVPLDLFSKECTENCNITSYKPCGKGVILGQRVSFATKSTFCLSKT